MTARLYATARFQVTNSANYSAYQVKGFEAQRYYVTEIAPMEIVVRAAPRNGYGTDNEEMTAYQIRTPYLIAITAHEAATLYLFARPAPISRNDEKLYRLAFPHVGTDGSVCYYPDKKNATQQFSQAQRSMSFVNEYLTTRYSYFLSPDQPHEVRTSTKSTGRLAPVQGFFEKLEQLSMEETLALSWQPDADLTRVLGNRITYYNSQALKLIIERFVP